MRFFKKIQIANPKQQEPECLSNGTIKRLETSEIMGNREKEEETGKINEGFEMIEEATGQEKSAMGNSHVKITKEDSKEVEGTKDPKETSKEDSKDVEDIKDSKETSMENLKDAEDAEDSEDTSKEREEKNRKRRHSNWQNLYSRIKLCLDHPNLIHWITLCLIGLATFGIIFSIAGSDFLPGSQLFSLILLFVLAYIGGALIKLIKLPSLLGMLLVGLLLRNVHFIHLKGVYMEVTATLREIALCIILIRAGLGLDPKALRSLKFVILRLASVPGITEGAITMIVTHFLLGLPWLWGLLLGAILAAVSPAVVIPCLFSLQERGYGTGKGIPTLVVAAASLDDILAITVFGVVLNFIYSSGTSVVMQIVQGPLGIILGIVFGIVWGFVAHFVPHEKDNQVVLLRVLMITGGGLMAIVGSGALGYQGAGPLGCIIAAFVACMGWRKQNYSDGHNPVAVVFRGIWLVFQPILFGLIGSEVDVSVLDMSIIGYGLIALFCSLLGRIVVTVFIAFGAGFNWKEKTFIAWAWFPKATVQAALGPLALDMARRNGSEEEIVYARTILVLAVLAILITAPLGAALIRTLGPKLLSKDIGVQKQAKSDDVESRDEDKLQT